MMYSQYSVSIDLDRRNQFMFIDFWHRSVLLAGHYGLTVRVIAKFIGLLLTVYLANILIHSYTSSSPPAYDCFVV